MNSQENEILFLKEQIVKQIEDLKYLRLEVMRLINNNNELHMTLQKAQQLLGDKKYQEIMEASKQHVKDVEGF